MRALLISALALALGACSLTPPATTQDAPTGLPKKSTGDASPTQPPARDPAGAPGSDRYAHSTDSPPPAEDRSSIERIPEPVPKSEPPSRYGNPATYSVWGQTYHVLPSSEGYEEEGLASWYGRKFHGYRTSSGEPYDMYRFTAAHRTLPLPTYVRVTKLSNNKQLVVRVNDRGPFHSDRIIDLSWAAAVRLGIEQNGTGHVRVEALTPEERPGGRRQGTVPTAVRAALDSPPPEAGKNQARSGDLYLQAGAFRALDGARDLERQLRNRLKLPVTVRKLEDSAYYKVWLGPFASLDDQEQARQACQQAGFGNPMPVR